MTPQPASTAAGSLLGGRYQVIKHLASGGMAEVHLARATGIGGFERYVVIKKILPDHARDQRFVTMFLDEARLAAQLHHTNIAQVYDIGEEEGTYFFAMEYVHGEDARELLRKVAGLRRRIPTEHVLAVVAGAAAGLHYAHDKRGPDRQPLGLVHRDVSPSNILVAYDGAVKLVDFGIAKAATRVTETRSGTLKGKVAYMSPEQCLGKPLDRRSDVFALGIVLYELSTVTRLFKADNDYVTMHQIVTCDIPPPSKRRADYPAGLEPIVMRCLTKDPEERYPTAGHLLEALAGYAVEHKLAMSPQGLGRFIRELFGERPEPWLVAEAAPVGHVSLREGDDLDDDAPRAITDSQVAPRSSEATVATVADTDAPPRVVARPASAVSASAVAPRRARWPWIVALVALSAAVGGVIAVRSKNADPNAVPDPAAVPGPAAAPAAAAEPEAEPVAVPDPVPAAGSGSGSASTAAPAVADPKPKPAATTKRKPHKPLPPHAAGRSPEAVTKPATGSGSGSATTTPKGRDPTILIRPSQKKDPAKP